MKDEYLSAYAEGLENHRENADAIGDEPFKKRGPGSGEAP